MDTKLSLTAPEVELNGSTEIDLNGPVTVQGNLTNTGGDLTVEDIIVQKILQGILYMILAPALI